MRRPADRRLAHKNGCSPRYPSHRSESPRNGPDETLVRSARCMDDAWDVFADEAEGSAEPEYGDFWPDQDDSDEV
jgi:hypothetical protein